MLIEDVAWFRIEHESAIGAARRAAEELANKLGLGSTRSAEVGLAVSEVAGNQLKHADGGVILLRACRAVEDGTAGHDAGLDPGRRVEPGVGVGFVAADAGPGIADIGYALADGHSTTGTLGIGLGAVVRLASTWDMYSAPGAGTVIAATFGQCGAGMPTVRAAGLTRPMLGQEACGDSYALRVDGTVVTAMLADGLGHGPLAATASAAAARAFRDAGFGSPATLLSIIHDALRETRGAAVAVAQVAGDGLIRYAGVGNIGAQVIGGERKRGLISYPGIAGTNAGAIREATYELPSHAVVVMHSDGVSEKLALEGYAGLVSCAPLVVAAVVLRDFGVRNDDAGVVVLAPLERA